MKSYRKEAAEDIQLKIVLVLNGAADTKCEEIRSWFYKSRRYSRIDVIQKAQDLIPYLQSDIQDLADMILIMDSSQTAQVEKTIAKMRLGKRIPVFVYSAEVNPLDIEHSYHLGVNGYAFAAPNESEQQMIPEIVANCYSLQHQKHLPH